MPDLAIKITTHAELAGALAVENALERQIGKMKAEGASADALKAKYQELNRVKAAIASSSVGRNPVDLQAAQALAAQIPVIGQYVGQLQSAQSALAGLSAGALPAAGAIAAVAVAIGSLVAGVKELDQAVTTEFKLAKALAATGQYSQQAQASLTALADKMEGISNIEAGEWLNQFARFIQTGGAVENVESFATATSKLADVMQVDLGTAASLVLRAIQGNDQALKRLGITLGEAGTPAERLAALLEALANRSDGLKKNTSALSEAYKSAKIAIGNYLEGHAVVMLAYAAATRALNIFDAVATKVTEIQGKIFPRAQQTAKNATEGTNQALDDYTVAVKNAATAVDELVAANERESKALKEKNSALTEAQKANRELARAEIDRLEKLGLERGGVSKDQATVLRAQSEQAFEMQAVFQRVRQMEADLERSKREMDARIRAAQAIEDPTKRRAALDEINRTAPDFNAQEESIRRAQAAELYKFGVGAQTRNIQTGTAVIPALDKDQVGPQSPVNVDAAIAQQQQAMADQARRFLQAAGGGNQETLTMMANLLQTIQAEQEALRRMLGEVDARARANRSR